MPPSRMVPAFAWPRPVGNRGGRAFGCGPFGPEPNVSLDRTGKSRQDCASDGVRQTAPHGRRDRHETDPCHTGRAVRRRRRAADPIEGRWQTAPDDNGNFGFVDVAPCARLLRHACRRIRRHRHPDRIAQYRRQIIWDTVANGDGTYEGRIYAPTGTRNTPPRSNSRATSWPCRAVCSASAVGRHLGPRQLMP